MSDLFHLAFSKYLFCHYSMMFIRERCVNFFTHTFQACFLRIKTQRMVIIFISKFIVLKVWFCSQDRQIIDHYLVMLRKTAYWRAEIIPLLLSALSAMWLRSSCHHEMVRPWCTNLGWLWDLLWQICYDWSECVGSEPSPHISGTLLILWENERGLTCRTDTLGIP